LNTHKHPLSTVCKHRPFLHVAKSSKIMTVAIELENRNKQQEELKSTIVKTKLECKIFQQDHKRQVAKVEELEQRIHRMGSDMDHEIESCKHPWDEAKREITQLERPSDAYKGHDPPLLQQRDDFASGDMRILLEQPEFAENDRLLLAQTCEAPEDAIETLQNARSRDMMMLTEANRHILELQAQLKLQSEHQTMLEQEIESLKDDNKKYQDQLLLDAKQKNYYSSTMASPHSWEEDRTIWWYQEHISSDSGQLSEKDEFHPQRQLAEEDIEVLQDSIALQYSKEQDEEEKEEEHEPQEHWVPLKTPSITEEEDEDTTTLSHILSEISPSTQFFLDTCDDSTISLSTHGSLSNDDDGHYSTSMEEAPDKNSSGNEVASSKEDTFGQFFSQRVSL
jgi:hypothetical protein